MDEEAIDYAFSGSRSGLFHIRNYLSELDIPDQDAADVILADLVAKRKITNPTIYRYVKDLLEFRKVGDAKVPVLHFSEHVRKHYATLNDWINLGEAGKCPDLDTFEEIIRLARAAGWNLTREVKKFLVMTVQLRTGDDPYVASQLQYCLRTSGVLGNDRVWDLVPNDDSDLFQRQYRGLLDRSSTFRNYWA